MNIRIDKYDKMYPIKIEDGWGGTANIHLWTIEDDEEWEDFINQLNFYREHYLNGDIENLFKNLQKKS